MKGVGVTTEQKMAALELVAELGRTIRDLSEVSPLGGVPSGELYARVMGMGVSVESYNKMIALLKASGMVTEWGHLLKWAGPPREQNAQTGDGVGSGEKHPAGDTDTNRSGGDSGDANKGGLPEK